MGKEPVPEEKSIIYDEAFKRRQFQRQEHFRKQLHKEEEQEAIFAWVKDILVKMQIGNSNSSVRK